MGRQIGYVAFYAGEIDSLSAQNLALSTCARVYTDELKRSDDQRPELGAALVALAPGDQLVINDLAVLAKSLPHLRRVIQSVSARGAQIAISGGSGAPSVLSDGEVAGILATIGVHTSLSNARALDGARSTTEPNGRRRVLDDNGKARMRSMLAEGKSQAEICRVLGISRTSAFRYRRELEAQAELAVV